MRINDFFDNGNSKDFGNERWEIGNKFWLKEEITEVWFKIIGNKILEMDYDFI